MKRILTELTKECECTVQMYALGYEKKEIASIKCRALSTISNQIQTAMGILHVRNGRELATMLYERMTGMKFTIEFSPAIQAGITCCLLLVLCLDCHFEMRKQRLRSKVNIESTLGVRIRTRGRDIPLLS